MEIRDLTYFLAIASTGHIGRAAASLGLTQPALTKSIGRIERELNAKVLERTPKGVTVTAFGKQVIRQATRLTSAMDDAKRELADLSKGETGHLRIGAGVAIAQYLLPVACARLLAECPRLSLDVVAGTGKSLAPQLRDGHLDLFVSGIAAAADPGQVQEPIMEDQVVVIGRRDHPLHKKRAPSLSEISRQQWVLSNGSLLNDWLAQRWRDAGLSAPVPKVRTNSVGALLSIVGMTDLVTFHSWSTIRLSPFNSALRPIARSPLIWRRTVGVVYREGGYLTPAARRLIDILIGLGKKHHGVSEAPDDRRQLHKHISPATAR